MIIGVPLRHEIFEDIIAQQSERLVVALPLFILHHATLVIELGLRHRAEQMPHAIGLKEQRPVKRARRHRLEIVGSVGIGRAILVGRADLRRILEEIIGRILRSVEHQMLEQMGKTGRSGWLMLGTDIVPDRRRHHRCLAIGVDQHGQAIVEHEALVGNVDAIDQRLHRFGSRCLGALLRSGKADWRQDRRGRQRDQHRQAKGSKTHG